MPFPAAYTETTRAIQLLETRVKKLVLQEMKKTYLYYRMLSAGNVLNIKGSSIEIPFYIAPPAMGRWFGKGDKLPDTSSTKIAMGFMTNRYVVVPVGWDMLEQWEQEGNPDKIFDLIDMKSAEQAWAMRRTLASAVWSGTGGKQPDGISTIIEAAAPGAQTAVVMGVDKATKAWFRNKSVQLTSNFGFLAAGTTIPAGFLALMALINQTTIGSMKPSDLVTTKDIFDTIRRAFLEVSSPYHMISDVNLAQWGFETFKFNGVTVAWDPDCPADKIYSLHLNQTFDQKVLNDPRDPGKLDTDIEKLGKSSLFDLDGGIFIGQHPNIKNRRIAPRSPYRMLEQTEWTVDSFNIGVKRPSDHGVAYSDNNARWSTW